MEERGPCEICSQNEQWHRDHKPRHDYVPEGADGTLTVGGKDPFSSARKKNTAQPPRADADHPLPPTGQVRAEVKIAQAPFDPVLRLALIRKGLITMEDLEEAEKEILVTSKIQEARLTGSSKLT